MNSSQIDPICKNCSHCIKVANTEETNEALCTYSDSFFPVKYNGTCVYLSNITELTCKDCDRFYNDTACMTAQENDPVNDCIGFIDKDETTIYDILFKWALQGKDYKEEIFSIIKNFEQEYKKPFIPKENN